MTGSRSLAAAALATLFALGIAVPASAREAARGPDQHQSQRQDAREAKKKARKEAYTSRAKQEFGEWIAGAEAVIA